MYLAKLLVSKTACIHNSGPNMALDPHSIYRGQSIWFSVHYDCLQCTQIVDTSK
jgi:hypothetical protein